MSPVSDSSSSRVAAGSTSSSGTFSAPATSPSQVSTSAIPTPSLDPDTRYPRSSQPRTPTPHAETRAKPSAAAPSAPTNPPAFPTTYCRYVRSMTATRPSDDTQEIIDGLFDRKRDRASANHEPRGGEGRRGVAQAQWVNSPTVRNRRLNAFVIEMLKVKPQSLLTVGTTGFEPVLSAPPVQRLNQAGPRPGACREPRPASFTLAHLADSGKRRTRTHRPERAFTERSRGAVSIGQRTIAAMR